ncbi:hypothetical protein CLAFUW4_07808 [Fulvia fulva]|uniref:Uncharacterized protein n=1 Tax=Passalora fulva TaxID=5499 RepID=A0A9Q8LF01_PASFU|nr:uncharacterized protein CLAFUR5_07932 [Fulvia fulva]KAK4629032.1 hypothetical protein CLAFUR4_07813 [Fulvia fulva]KAK4630378.1 hypothetical protein CLAFUR0_07810 [Fulvia fulva]UJO15473.1 hypothetical protein CLAFUR5_07932 [Fulvia fulva]WPV12694.1 hypothetical protein CLAFUW4_07808 [Fulvia fulva]WPV27038.1 hypothetical protein CLAFUW7_07809 [Fulvia fulva]
MREQLRSLLDILDSVTVVRMSYWSKLDELDDPLDAHREAVTEVYKAHLDSVDQLKKLKVESCVKMEEPEGYRRTWKWVGKENNDIIDEDDEW